MSLLRSIEEILQDLEFSAGEYEVVFSPRAGVREVLLRVRFAESDPKGLRNIPALQLPPIGVLFGAEAEAAHEEPAGKKTRTDGSKKSKKGPDVPTTASSESYLRTLRPGQGVLLADRLVSSLVSVGAG